MNNRIGDYSILRLLGKGATACVYLCQKNQEPPVAIKWLHEENPRWIRRFFLECETLRRIKHPNIPRFISQGKHNNRSYLVMEYIAGVSGEIFAEKAQKLPPSERHQKCMLIGQQAAEALWMLHQQNILHRDLKPSNLMITNDTKPVLLDFGTLKNYDSDFTFTGQFIGTPRYASPEQLEGIVLCAKSDQFSLGATLYYLLIHRRPFQDRERKELIPPSFFDPSIPNDLEEAILRLLAFNPEDRFNSMLEVQKAFSAQTNLGSPLAGREEILDLIAQLLSRAGQGEQLVISLNGCKGIGKNWVSETIKQGAKRQNIATIDVFNLSQFEKAQKLLTKRTPLLLLTRCNEYQNFGIPIINIDIPFLSLAEIRRSVHGYAPQTTELSTLSEALHTITGGLPGLLLPLLERYTQNQCFILPENFDLPEKDIFFKNLSWEDITILSVLALSSQPLTEALIEKISNIYINEQCKYLEKRGLIRKNQYGWFCVSSFFAQEALRLCPDTESLLQNIKHHVPKNPQSLQTYDDILIQAASGHLAEAKQEILSHLEKNISPKNKAKALLVAGQIFLDIGDYHKANQYLSDATALGKSQHLWKYHALSHSYRARISLEKHNSNGLGASLAIDRLISIIKTTSHPITISIWAWAVAALGDQRAWKKALHQLEASSSQKLNPIDEIRIQFYLVQGFASLGQVSEAKKRLEILLPKAKNYALLTWELKRAHSILTGHAPPITGPLAYNLTPTEILLLKKRWMYVKGKSPDPTWKD